jgi:peptide/nickel transport system permease protein
MNGWKKFARRKGAVLALSWILLTIVLALAAPVLARAGNGLLVRYDPDSIALGDRLLAPDSRHWLGTDDLGRDLTARLIHGARVSMFVGCVAALVSLIVGSFAGAIAGYFGGAIDWIVSRIIEVVLCFPFLFLVLGIVALFKPGLWTIIVALGLTSWTQEARLVRGEFLRLRDLDYARAAEAAGAGHARIIVRHLLPNAIPPALVSASFGVASAILIESALSFLGLGSPLPTASWGGVLSSADRYLGQAWWLSLFPGALIFTTVVAFNTIGDRLRDVLDPASE